MIVDDVMINIYISAVQAVQGAHLHTRAKA